MRLGVGFRLEITPTRNPCEWGPSNIEYDEANGLRCRDRKCSGSALYFFILKKKEEEKKRLFS